MPTSKTSGRKITVVLGLLTLIAGFSVGWLKWRNARLAASDPGAAAGAEPDVPQGNAGRAVAGSRAARPPAPATSLPPPTPASPAVEEVPAPVGQALMGLGRYRAREVYNAEQRHPIWAPRMETQLQARFNPTSMAKFPGLRVADVECRTSTCRVTIEYTQELMDQLFPGQKDNPEQGYVFDRFTAENGPFARLSNMVLPREPLRETAVFVFGKNDIDPARYTSWLDDTRKRLAQRREEKQRAAAQQAAPPR
jgi:hypothetical protein